MQRIYLDHTASTPLDPRVLDAMLPYFSGLYGNASSIHSFGREARAALESSRETIARHLGCRSSEVFFVSGGTEADNTAIKGIAWKMRELGKNQIITSKAEHHAVLESCQFLAEAGFSITYLDVDQYGGIDPDLVRRSITPATGLVTLMHANNEVGTLNPLDDIAALVEDRGIPFHSDAVQSFGRLEFTVDDLGVDLLSTSAHKIYGPKGIGALFIRKGVNVERFIHGGGQERGRRAGTENVSLAVGFAKATELAFEDREAEDRRLKGLNVVFRRSLEERFENIVFNGHPVNSLPHIVNISFDSKKIRIDGEALLFNMDLAGIAVTSGSACTSGSLQPSHVLLAMGRDESTARATIRFSMGRSTTEEQIDRVVNTLDDVVRRIGRPVPATQRAT